MQILSETPITRYDRRFDPYQAHRASVYRAFSTGREVTKGGSVTDVKIHSISGPTKATNPLTQRLERWETLS